MFNICMMDVNNPFKPKKASFKEYSNTVLTAKLVTMPSNELRMPNIKLRLEFFNLEAIFFLIYLIVTFQSPRFLNPLPPLTCRVLHKKSFGGSNRVWFLLLWGCPIN